MRPILRFLLETDGTTAVEYAVMLAMVLLAVIGTVATFGGQTGTLWTNSANKIEAAGVGS